MILRKQILNKQIECNMCIKTHLFNCGCIKNEFSQVCENKLHPYSHLNQQAPALSINSKLAYNELAF